MIDPLSTVQSWVLVLAVGIPWVIGATFIVLGAIHAVDVAAEWLRRRVRLRGVEPFGGGSVSWTREPAGRKDGP